MKKLLANVKLFRLLSILALSLIMVATTAISFVYWKSGIEGANTNKDLTVQIGEGHAVSATLELSESTTPDKRLIPKSRPTDSNTATKLTFVISVVWVPGTDVTGTPYAGTLNVDASSLVFNNVEMINAKTNGNMDLFDIKISHDARINASDVDGTTNKVNVTVTIELNEPMDSVQYYKIAGKNGILTLLFEVESDSEMSAG